MQMFDVAKAAHTNTNSYFCTCAVNARKSARKQRFSGETNTKLALSAPCTWPAAEERSSCARMET